MLESKIQFEGFFCVYNNLTNEKIFEGKNSINYENMSIALAKTLSGITTSQIYTMVFGNGGTAVSGTGAITYLPPNTSSIGAQLYNQTYEKTGLTASIATSDPNYNADKTIVVNHINNTTYSDIVVVCTLEYDEPSDQSAFDNTDLTDSYTFNELGLMTQDGFLLTHAIFAPTAKALNVALRIEYTVRIKTH